MTDGEGARARKEQAQAREFPETLAVLAEVRAAMVDRLFASPQAAAAERERLYQAVQVLDAMRNRMTPVLASGSAAIEAYVKAVAEGEGVSQ